MAVEPGLQNLASRKKHIPPGSIISNHGIRHYYDVGLKEKADTEEQTLRVQEHKVADIPEEKMAKSYRDTQTSPFPLPPHLKDKQSIVKVDRDIQTSPAAPPVQTGVGERYNRQQVDNYMQTSPALNEFISPRNPSPTRSYGNRTVFTEDYYHALSRHTGDPVFEPPLDRSVSIDIPPTTGNRTPPTPLPVAPKKTGKVAPDVLIVNRKDEAVNTSPRFILPTVAKSTQINNMSSIAHQVVPIAGGRRVVLQQQPYYAIQSQIPAAPMCYLVQSEDSDDSDEEPEHFYYGPNNERLPGPLPGYHNNISSLPGYHDVNSYMYQPQYHSTNTRPTAQPRQQHTYFKLNLLLEHGYITDVGKAGLLPHEIQEELMRAYGHMKSTEVLVVNQGGSYTIHSNV